MKVIKDLRILKAIERRYNFEFDRTWKYCLRDNGKWHIKYKGEDYAIKYFDGCFYPYLVKI